ncbi:MAG: asparagine synthase (glutamine-hydrolyzing) [Candidatus Competibacteraceae bacterium]
MCGVAGIYAYDDRASPIERKELHRINDYMAARGPDGQGAWYSTNGRVALGHRRLSIIDLSERGAQPMSTADGRLTISFNGEIYNYRCLQQQLEAKGFVFESDSDTEVLLHLYADRGTEMFGDLRGMFAFVLWDACAKRLLLARDPYGIKPLYYADNGRTVRIASQVKALLAGGGVSRQPEPAGFAGLLLFGSVPEPYTIWLAIRSVPAGSFLWADDKGAGAPQCYFSIAQVFRAAVVQQPTPLNPRDLQESVRAGVLDSVRHHLVADVPVGAFLSAGVDSGSLVGLMRDAGQQDVQTVTLKFAEFRGQPRDESGLAEQLARCYGTRHTTRVVTEQEFKQDLPRILDAMDQPSIDGINTWFVSKAAREIPGLKVAISGLGGDELLGGYPSFRDIPRWVRTLHIPSRVPLLSAAWRRFASLANVWWPKLSPK